MFYEKVFVFFVSVSAAMVLTVSCGNSVIVDSRGGTQQSDTLEGQKCSEEGSYNCDQNDKLVLYCEGGEWVKFKRCSETQTCNSETGNCDNPNDNGSGNEEGNENGSNGSNEGGNNGGNEGGENGGGDDDNGSSSAKLEGQECETENTYNCDRNGAIVLICDPDTHKWAAFKKCSGNKKCNSVNGTCTEANNNGGDNTQCGNKMIDEGELCDGGAVECSSISSNFTDGFAYCLDDCHGYDTSECRIGGGDDGGDTEETGKKCKLGDLLALDTPADRYVAFKGSGVINPAGSFENFLQGLANPSMASLVGVDYAGIPDASFQYVSQLSFYEATDDGVQLTALGNIFQQRYLQTALFISIPFEYLEYMKENEIFDLPQSTKVQLLVNKYSPDIRYIGQCVYASKVVAEGSGQYIPGKMRVCHEKNKTFGEGETLKLNMVSEIGSDEETVAFFPTLDKACSCYDNDKIPENAEQIPADAYVDCDTVDWNATSADTEKCTEAGGTWDDADDTCDCGDGKIWNDSTCEEPV